MGYTGGGALLAMRRWLDELPLPLLPQQHVQHLQQQMVHSAAQQRQRATHVMTEMAMMAATMIATMTGHLGNVSGGTGGSARWMGDGLAVRLLHALIPGAEGILCVCEDVAGGEQRHGRGGEHGRWGRQRERVCE